jgi:peptide/nickel transport system substrate-binding protein
VRRQLLALALTAVAAIVIAQPGSSARGQEGGILRVLVSPFVYDHVDPALSYSPPGWSLLEAICARLYTYPDKASPGSFRVRPEVAASYSRSADLKTYTFTLRRGFRFSNGEPVRASAFARAINRALDPDIQSPGATFMDDILGAEEVLAGNAEKARGVVARGYTLVVRFERPAPNFLARTALPFLCAVPPWLPPSPEGIGKIPSAGPYYVKEYRAGEGIDIRRNPYYGGARKVHLEGFDVNLQGGGPVEPLRSIDRGEADWGWMAAGVVFRTPGLDLVAKYGVNKSRFWVRPGLTLRMIFFNSSRPLFHDNPRLRRAVNLALNRRAQVTASYGAVASTATDQHIPRGIPGFRNADVYPLEGDLARAQELARGHLRDGTAVLRVAANTLEVEIAQLVKKQLAPIGLDIEIKAEPGAAWAPSLAELTRPGAARRAEWDMRFVLWAPAVPDAHEYLSLLLETHLQMGESVTRARSMLLSGALARAAGLPPGRARNRAYADLDEMVARDIAPVAALSVLNEATFVSERVECLVLRPALDLAVACLK